MEVNWYGSWAEIHLRGKNLKNLGLNDKVLNWLPMIFQLHKSYIVEWDRKIVIGK